MLRLHLTVIFVKWMDPFFLQVNRLWHFAVVGCDIGVSTLFLVKPTVQ